MERHLEAVLKRKRKHEQMHRMVKAMGDNVDSRIKKTEDMLHMMEVMGHNLILEEGEAKDKCKKRKAKGKDYGYDGDSE